MARRRSSREGKTGREGERGEDVGFARPSGEEAVQGLVPPRDPLRPWLLTAAVALWVARPLYPSESAAMQGDGLPAVMLWMVLAVIWLVGAIRQPRFRLRLGWVDVALLALVVWHTVSAIWWAGRASPRPAVNMLWEWVGFAVSFFLTRQLLAGPRECRALLAVMCGLAVALAALGGYQYAYDLPAMRAEYAKDPNRYLLDAGFWAPPGSPERLAFEKRLASVEPIATFALTNSLAGLLAPWLVVLTGLAILDRTAVTRRPNSTSPTQADSGRPEAIEGRARAGNAANRPFLLGRRLSLAGMFACALVVAACLVLTKSRSAFLATALGLAMVGWMWRGGNRRLPWKAILGAGLLAAALVAAAYAAGGLDREVLTEATKSLGYRGQYWRSSLAMIADHPVLGCGPGNFQWAYTAYKLPEASEEIADPHNFLIEVWATAGTPAMLAFVAVLAGFFVAALRQERPSCEGSTPEAIRDDAERPALVYVGAPAGFLLALPLSVVSPAPPGWSLFLKALPCVGLTLASLWKRVTEGRSPPGLPAVGVAVLLVHLSASGGMGFAGVAGSLWLLMAIGLNLVDGWKDRLLPKWTAWIALAVVGLATLACYATGYSPVLRSQAAWQRAQRHPLEADYHLLQAAEADPWAMQPWNHLAALAFEAWKASPQDEKAVRRFLGYTEHLLARAPRSAALWESTGDRFLQMHQMTHQAQYLQQAERCFRTAVELYPNLAALRAKLALALRTAGDLSGYEEERARALELDRITPHLDKKLPAELREALNRS